MGTVTALVESGELSLVRDEGLRREILRYHTSVTSALRIIDAVDPHMWRTLERLGGTLNFAAIQRPGEAHRWTNDWESLASDRAFHGALYDLRLASHNRLFALKALHADLDSLQVELARSSR
jgi:hypothetical protein